LGLELPYPAPRRRQLKLLAGRRALSLAAIDPVLLEPVVDRRLRHLKGRRELPDLRAGARQLDHLATDLRAVMTWHLGSPLCRSIPEPRLHFSRVRSVSTKAGELQRDVSMSS